MSSLQTPAVQPACEAGADQPASEAATAPSPFILPSIDVKLHAALERSIRARGCLVPILVGSDGTVIDGLLREAIGEKHGIYVPRIVIGNLDHNDRITLRLLLNGLRRHLTREEWTEVVAYELMRTPERSDRSIAGSIGVSHNTVARTRRTLEGNGQLDHCSTRTTSDARQFPSQRKPIVFAETERAAKKAAEILETVGADLPARPLTLRKLKSTAHALNQEKERAASKPVTLGDGIEVIASDFRELGDRVPDESASLLMLDPAWGADGESPLFRQELAEVSYRLAKPGKFAAIYTGVGGISDFTRHFEAAGWAYRWMVACERQSSNVYSRIFRRWVPIVVFQKPPGKFAIPGYLTDRISGGKVEKEIHHWAQPANESRLIIEALTSAGELVVDLTCGSCSSAIGMIEAAGGTRRYFGCDTDAVMIKAARSRIAARLATP